jgi:hypothetical protein
MYRYIVDNAVTYTSEDFVLFRESPFACWMERLTLENPDHGIPPDIGSLPPGDSIDRQDDMADTLRAEGKDVRLIDWEADEPDRRSATLDAMRRGADFIVNGQLALGPLSGAANLLVRTSGYSELGDFLYIPCETQTRSSLHSAFGLCFLADLLHSLQGQLPPQMLIIRGGDDLVPLQTDSHIYHYRAVKQRFMEAMRNFRKHRMPDPAESSHFGRWSDCAHEVLKQRLLREEHPAENSAGDTDDNRVAEPLRQAVGAAVGGGSGSYDRDDITPSEANRTESAITALAGAGPDARDSQHSNSAAGGVTLAEQARMLKPGTYKPGPGVYRLGRPRTAAPVTARGRDDEHPAPAVQQETVSGVPPRPREAVAADRPKFNRRASDAALQNLEFIGSTAQVPGPVPNTSPVAAPQPPVAGAAPAPSLRDPRTRMPDRESFVAADAPAPTLGKAAAWSLPPQVSEEVERVPERPGAAGESGRADPAGRSAVDMDGSHFASPPPVLTTSNTDLPADFGFEMEEIGHGFGQSATEQQRQAPRSRPFEDSIFNSGIFTEGEPEEGGFSDTLITSDNYDT